MPFQIMVAPVGTEEYQPYGNPLAIISYETGMDAARAMARLRTAFAATHRYKVAAIVEPGVDPDAWKERENERRSHTYVDVPWRHDGWHIGPLYHEHFVHLSVKQPGCVAFTESAEKGRADRQTIMAPGRYLTKFFSDVLTAEHIEQLAAEVSALSGECELNVTQDADEIEEIYTNGPASCMSRDESDYESPCHPVRVYAGPDLGIAYTGTADDASGRCVVWPEKKLHGTVYGDCSRMRIMLASAGYTQGRMDGARVRRITCDRGFVMPYVDDAGAAADDGTFLILGGGHISTCSTEGVTEEEEEEGDYSTCERCSARVYDEEGTYIESINETWCDHCANNYTTYCNSAEERMPDYGNTFVEVSSFHTLYGGGGYLGADTICVDNADDYGAVEMTDEDGDGTDEWVRVDDFAPLMENIAALAAHFAAPSDQLCLAWPAAAFDLAA